MKKSYCLLLLLFFLCLAFLLCACGQDGASLTTSTAPAPTLVGVWVNAGQYSEGRDFVETLTLREDGVAAVHLEYRGEDYASLEGRWTAEGDLLSVDFTDPNTRDRTYHYTLTETTLFLTGDGKDVEYVRQ